MQKNNSEQKDELRPEYDLRSLQVRRMGAERKRFGEAIVRLDPDVAAMFPSAEAVNEALRSLARVAQENQTRLLKPQPNSSMTTDG